MIPKKLDGSSHTQAIKRAATLLFFACCVLLTFFDFSSNYLDLEVGDTVQENVVAPRRIVDREATKNLREIAAANTPPVTDYIISAADTSSQLVIGLLDALDASYPDTLNPAFVAALNSIANTDFRQEDFAFYQGLPLARKALVRERCLSVLSEMYAGQVGASPDELALQGEHIDALSAASPIEAREASFISHALKCAIRPNYITNEALTAAARENARKSVVDVVYENGETIIQRGERLSQAKYDLLMENGMLARASLLANPVSNGARLALVAAFTMMLVASLSFFHRDIARNAKSYVLILVQFFFTLLMAKLISSISVFLVPVSFLTMTVSVIFTPRVGVQCNVILIMFLCVALGLDVDSIVYLLVSGYMGVAYMRQVNSRIDFIKSGFAVAAANVLALFTVFALRNNLTMFTPSNVLYAIGGGVVSSLLAIVTLLVWESLFNITTPFRLLEMCAPGDPLIQMLITNAPGTYHHCLLVSNIAEAACRVIGANALLARVGAYYHDIGKVEKAAYFRENQSDGHNPHDNILPEVSARIIKNHVSDGYYLALKHRIPSEITEFIATHHGTSEIAYFKHEAEENGYEGDEDFTYAGRLPVSRETTVVMLADSVEAAVRSMEIHNEETIAQMVDRIVARKLHDKQLSASRLTFEQLELVKEAFTSSLISVYHNRLKYPEPEESEEDAMDEPEPGTED